MSYRSENTPKQHLEAVPKGKAAALIVVPIALAEPGAICPDFCVFQAGHSRAIRTCANANYMQARREPSADNETESPRARLTNHAAVHAGTLDITAVHALVQLIATSASMLAKDSGDRQIRWLEFIATGPTQQATVRRSGRRPKTAPLKPCTKDTRPAATLKQRPVAL